MRGTRQAKLKPTMTRLAIIESTERGRRRKEAGQPRPSFAGKRLAREWQTIAAMIGCYCRGPSRCRRGPLPGVPGASGLCRRPAGALPVWVGEARLRQVPGPLLSARPARTGQSGDALCRSAHAVAASDSEPAPLAGWLSQGAGSGLSGGAAGYSEQLPLETGRTRSIRHGSGPSATGRMHPSVGRAASIVDFSQSSLFTVRR